MSMPWDTEAYEKDYVQKSTGCQEGVFVGFAFSNLPHFSFEFFKNQNENKKSKKKIKCATTLARSNLDWEFKQIQISNFNSQGSFDAQKLLRTELINLQLNTSNKLACHQKAAWYRINLLASTTRKHACMDRVANPVYNWKVLE